MSRLDGLRYEVMQLTSPFSPLLAFRAEAGRQQQKRLL
jgi:hypothetical protein